MESVWIGTSGWSYKHWKGKFYPKRKPQKDWLRWYATNFGSVEINASFYHLPTAEIFSAWKNKTPNNFLFSVKAPGRITHLLKLKDCQEPLQDFLAHASCLRHKLGPILFQLPPHFPVDLPLLQDFIDSLPTDHNYVFEFRDASWLCDQVFECLANKKIALCRSSSASFPAADAITAPYIYQRMHGAHYDSCYSETEIAALARNIGQWLSKKLKVYVYFNNDANAFAVQNARLLLTLLA